MKIDQETLNKIRNDLNIVDVIGGYIPLTKKGKNYFGICPFHDDHSPSMSVSEEKQIYKCFTCGESGNVFTFIEKYENVSFLEAVSVLASKAGIVLNLKTGFKKEKKYHNLYEIMDLALKFYQNNLKTKKGEVAREYLTSRGIDDKIIADFKIGVSLDEKDSLTKLLLGKGYKKRDLEAIGLTYNGMADQFVGRIMFPLHNSDGDVIGFSSRIYRGEDAPKYINTKETIIFKKGENLYNYHLAKDEAKRKKEIILVEGQMDAIRLYASGFKNVVATGGTALTKEQISLLKKLRVSIILCLDNDDAGFNATYTMGEILTKENMEVKVIRLDKAKDPDEYILKYGGDSFKNNLLNPLKYFDFKLIYLKKNRDLNNSIDLANYINDIIENLNNIDDDILKEITLKKVSEDYGIDIDVLKSKLTKKNKEIIIKRQEVIKQKKKHDKYEQAMASILFYMMNDVTYIKMYDKKLGYIPIPKYRMIVNEILYFYELNKYIDLADFISFISDKIEIRDVVKEIIASNDEIVFEDFELFIKIVKEYIYKDKIRKIKEEMKEELDINRKIELATKLTNLKKGSVLDD